MQTTQHRKQQPLRPHPKPAPPTRIHPLRPRGPNSATLRRPLRLPRQQPLIQPNPLRKSPPQNIPQKRRPLPPNPRQQRRRPSRRRASPTLIRLRPRVFQKPLRRILPQRLRPAQQCFKRPRPALLNKTIRVLPRRQKQKRNTLAVAQRRKDSFQSPPSRRLSRVVPVKRKDNIIRRPRQRRNGKRK